MEEGVCWFFPVGDVFICVQKYIQIDVNQHDFITKFNLLVLTCEVVDDNIFIVSYNIVRFKEHIYYF